MMTNLKAFRISGMPFASGASVVDTRGNDLLFQDAAQHEY